MKCLQPISVKDKIGNRHFVPCGKCAACFARKRKDWIFRLKQEHKNSTSAFFVTLTYDDENVPRDGQLNKEDPQRFLKRLRKFLSQFGYKIRYFLIGEYGDKFGRPHYHMLLFNFPHHAFDVQRTLEKNWSKGFVSIGEVTDKSIAYCTKYALKGFFESGDKRPFVLCAVLSRPLDLVSSHLKWCPISVEIIVSLKEEQFLSFLVSMSPKYLTISVLESDVLKLMLCRGPQSLPRLRLNLLKLQ